MAGASTSSTSLSSLYIRRYSAYELREYKSLNELSVTLSDPPTLTFEFRPGSRFLRMHKPSRCAYERRLMRVVL